MASTPNLPNTPKVQSCRVTAANVSTQGGGTIGTDIFLLLQAGASGTFVDRVRFCPTATSQTPTVATTANIYVSSVASGATTSANTTLIGTIAFPIVTAAGSTVSALTFDVPLNISIPTGMNLLVTQTVAPAANTAWVAVAFAGDF